MTLVNAFSNPRRPWYRRPWLLVGGWTVGVIGLLTVATLLGHDGQAPQIDGSVSGITPPQASTGRELKLFWHYERDLRVHTAG
jgi:hypothetical protein